MDIRNATTAAPPAPNLKEASKYSEAAENFEAVFLGMVVNEMMKETMPSTMNGGQGEEMFRSLMGNAIGEQIAQSGGIGLTDTIEAQMKAYAK
jgi:Rod binding domain-containing protein